MSTSCVRMLCPNLQCRAVLSVPVAARGKNVRCRTCGMRIQVPAGPTAPGPAASSEATPAGRK